MKKNETLIQSLILALSLYGLNAEATTYVYRNFIPGVDSSVCRPSKLGSTLDISYTGSLQQIPIPADSVYAQLTVIGAGGGGGNPGPYNGVSSSGGDGSLVSGELDIPSNLNSFTVLIGGGGQAATQYSGGGGGLTGVFSGSPSSTTALIVAGGGGGGPSTNASTPYLNGTNAGFMPGSGNFSIPGGIGYGGGGHTEDSSGTNGPKGTSFGAGGPSAGFSSSSGGFGGGAAGGLGWGGGGGGGGMPGGSGGGGNSDDTSYGGEGGTSFVASSITNVTSGTGALGGYDASAGNNGSASITFYGCS